MDKRDKLRAQMIENAAEINRLHARIHETFAHRAESDDLHGEWSRACEEFHARFGQLSVPGGWDSEFLERLKRGDEKTVEVALCFLEVRPYFFRSGYMWKDLLRRCKHAPMNVEQAERFSLVLNRYQEWKTNRELLAARGARIREGLSPLLARLDLLFPVIFRDSDLNDAKTVGGLYIALCRALRLPPLEKPETSHGKARKPYSPGRFVRFPSLELFKSETHCRSSWNAADVWATLAATIREVYALSNEFPIGISTILPIAGRKYDYRETTRPPVAPSALPTPQ